MKDLCFLSLRFRFESKELFIVEVPFQIYKLVLLQVELAAQEHGRPAHHGRRHVEVSYSEAGVFWAGKWMEGKVEGKGSLVFCRIVF